MSKNRGCAVQVLQHRRCRLEKALACSIKILPDVEEAARLLLQVGPDIDVQSGAVHMPQSSQLCDGMRRDERLEMLLMVPSGQTMARGPENAHRLSQLSGTSTGGDVDTAGLCLQSQVSITGPMSKRSRCG